MNVVVDGLMTNYQKTGDGPVVIFLHGWGDSAKTFEPLTNKLSKRYRLLALDLPGFGGSQLPEQAWGLDDYADFVADWLKKIDVKNLHAVIAHSNGGAIAIKALSTGKLKADKLVLIASAGIRDKQKARKRLLKSAAKAGKSLTFFLPSSSKQRLKGNFYEAIGSDATLLPQLEATFRKVVNEDVQLSAQKINIPTLLVYGDNDKSTPPAYGQIFNKLIPGSKLEAITGGHFIHHEQPEKIAGLIAGFLEAE